MLWEEFVCVYGCLWESMGVRTNLWNNMSMLVTMRIMEFHGCLWEFVRICGGSWEYMEVYGSLDEYE